MTFVKVLGSIIIPFMSEQQAARTHVLDNGQELRLLDKCSRKLNDTVWA